MAVRAARASGAYIALLDYSPEYSLTLDYGFAFDGAVGLYTVDAGWRIVRDTVDAERLTRAGVEWEHMLRIDGDLCEVLPVVLFKLSSVRGLLGVDGSILFLGTRLRARSLDALLQALGVDPGSVVDEPVMLVYDPGRGNAILCSRLPREKCIVFRRAGKLDDGAVVLEATQVIDLEGGGVTLLQRGGYCDPFILAPVVKPEQRD